MFLRGSLVGKVHVDAGLMMCGDPCYTIGKTLGRMKWSTFLHKFLHGPAATTSTPGVYLVQDGTAVVCSTGHGDGTYPVYADINRGVVRSITIVFDADEDDHDWDC
jgi:hypothetical protein